MLRQTLKNHNIEFDDLSLEEKATILNLVSAHTDSQFSVGELKEAVRELIYVIERKIVDVHPLDFLKMLKLRARMQNYLQLEYLLSAPERAKQQLETALSNYKKSS